MADLKVFIVNFLLVFSLSLATIAQTSTPPKLVQSSTADGGKIEAAFFESSLEKTVIFAHGAVFNKESWYFLARKLLEEKISALAIDFRGYGNSKGGATSKKYFDILGAVEYLKQKGFKEIDIMGGSMGGAAVLEALSRHEDPLIGKIILLAPAGGPPITSNTISKLFIVSKEEGLYQRVRTIYTQSSEPKTLKEFPGKYHAQNMFKADYADHLVEMMIHFIHN